MFHVVTGALTKSLWTRLLLLAAVAGPRFLQSRAYAAEEQRLNIPASKLSQTKISLRDSARRFASCLSHGNDVNVAQFTAASEEFVKNVEKFGDFTARGVNDARQNIKRVQQAHGSRISSMRALLMDQVRLGARRADGGPERRTGAEALLWSRLGISLWVEIFKDRIKSKKASLADATRNGFQRSMARYFDRFSRAAFHAASRATPDWDEVRERTQLGCDNGVCSDEQLHKELHTFVKDVEPVLNRMTELQKSVGLEDPRTP